MTSIDDGRGRGVAQQDGEHTFFHQGKEVRAGGHTKFKVLVPYAHDPELKQGEAFASEDELLEWVAGRPEEAAVRGIWDRLQRVRSLPSEKVDVDTVIGRRRRSVERIFADMKELSQESGLAIDSGELFELATRPADPLEVPVFDPVSFFTGLSPTGFLPFVNWLPLGGGFWRLAWFGWDNLPRSWRYSGWVWAFNGEFWNGNSVLSGWFPLGYGPLSAWGMDQVISSVIVA
jgi:hypothetical protein